MSNPQKNLSEDEEGEERWWQRSFIKANQIMNSLAKGEELPEEDKIAAWNSLTLYQYPRMIPRVRPAANAIQRSITAMIVKRIFNGTSREAIVRTISYELLTKNRTKDKYA